MVFQEPKVELIEIGLNNIIATSCTSDANARPTFQSCSTDADRDAHCESSSNEWGCEPVQNVWADDIAN